MTAFICSACGTQYPPSEAPPDACLICTDERQYVYMRAELNRVFNRDVEDRVAQVS